MNAKILALREKCGVLVTGMRAMLDKADAEKRDLTDVESKEFDAMKAEQAKIEASIAREESLLALEAKAAAVQPRIVAPVAPGGTAITAVHARYGKLKAFKGENADERAYRSGMWARAALFGDESARRYCNDNGIRIQAAQGGDVNTKGGFLVPEEFNQTIIDLRETYGVARQECNVMPMARDTLSMPRRLGGLTAYFTDENPSSAITESEATWDNVSLTAKKLATLTRMSTEIAEDAVINLADWIANEIAYAFATKEDDCLFNGTGTSTYGGIYGVLPKLIADSRVGAVAIPTVTHDLFSEVDATDIATLMAKLPQFALPGAKFYCSQVCYSLVFERLVQAAGGNTINDMSAGAQKRYMGYPIVISQKLPLVTTAINDTVMFLFGNLRQAATIGDRRGITVATSTDRYFDTDQIGIRGTERFDINVHDLGDATNAGPIVGLVGSTS